MRIYQPTWKPTLHISRVWHRTNATPASSTNTRPVPPPHRPHPPCPHSHPFRYGSVSIRRPTCPTAPHRGGPSGRPPLWRSARPSRSCRCPLPFPLPPPLLHHHANAPGTWPRWPNALCLHHAALHLLTESASPCSCPSTLRTGLSGRPRS